MSSNSPAWFTLSNPDEVPSPSLLIYPDRVASNISRMLEIAGGVERIRPHIKTHKLPELLQLHLEMGIRKFKCATIAEAESAAEAGARDVLLAYQPVGPNIQRLLELVKRFPKTRFKTILDDSVPLQKLSTAFIQCGMSIEALLDVDCGQHRAGIMPDDRAFHLYRQLAAQPGVRAGGLHVYDGHIQNLDPTERTKACEAAFAPVQALRERLLAAGLPVPTLITGGTPTFPIHARHLDRECSPGTTVLWDAGYNGKFPDLDFHPAAALLTRVVSKPDSGRLCLDLGHKAVASEGPHPRVLFPQLPDATAIMHSEEHLVIATSEAASIPIGSCLYGIPWHICPTVALHSEVYVVKNREASMTWMVKARARRITI